MCQFCNVDIVMKSWVVGMNQTREKLRSLNLHLTKKHEVEGRIGWCFWWATSPWRSKNSLNFLLNGNWSTLEDTLFTDVCCAFCGKKFHFKRELLKHLNLTNWSSMLEEKPYNYAICQFKFRLKYSIHCHKRRKHCCNV